MGVSSRTTFFVLFLAALLAFVNERYYAIRVIINNRPDRLPSVKAFSDYKIKLQDQVRNCEDAVIDESRGIAILSCDPGRDKWNTVMGTFVDSTVPGSLWVYRYSDFDSQEERAHRLRVDGFNETQLNGFHPLGMEYWPETSTVYVSNHAKSGPKVEIFKLNEDETGFSLQHQRTLSHPLIHAPNSLVAVSDDELYMTNDHKWKIGEHPKKSMFETYLAYPGGSIVYINLKTNTYKELANIPFANGVTALNKTHLAVASTAQPSVIIFKIDPESISLTETAKLRPAFMVDNLSTDSNGHLLMAGHPDLKLLKNVAKTNQFYDLDGTGKGKPEAERPRAPSWVAEWDGNAEGVIRDIYVGTEYGTGCTAARDVGRGLGIVSGLYEKGIFVWKE
ncbi:hypothetical protein MW887_004653 [Aspergillus wentii]|nr:hypothetical protein MW887_004653 [Aspergillus wentii]